MRTKLLKSLLTIACLLCSIGVYAHDFEVDGIYYQITAENEVAVTYKGSSHDSFIEYTGVVIIPDSITFNGTIYTVTSIGVCAFYDCFGLTEITIPNSVTSIGNNAFSHCTGLTELSIPNSVTAIGDFAFYNCTGLTSVTIPNSVTSIGYYPFPNCDGLISIKVEEGNTVYDSREGCNAIIETATNTLVAGCKNTVIPNSVTSIGSYTFNGCTDLTSITIPNSVTSIGHAAFSGCSGLTEITIPNSVTSIGDAAFANCFGLTSVTIPESVTSIGQSAFSLCTGLTSIRIEAVNPPAIEESTFNVVDKTIPVYVPAESLEAYQSAEYWSEFTNIVAYTELEAGDKFTVDSIHYEVLNESGQVAVTYYGEDAWNVPEEYKYAGEVVIPESVTYEGVTYSVTWIGDHAFRNCDGLTSVTIPNSVTWTASNAFYACDGLTSIKVEEGNTGYDSRENCNAIIETATNTLVAGCKNTVIPNSVTSIGDNAFYHRGELTTITIPESVTSIGNGAFFQCHGLTEITIPESVTSIGNSAFYYCDGLTSITIPNSVTSIGYLAFSYCSGLTSIVVEEDNTVYDSREDCNAIIETATNTLVAGCKKTIIPNSVTSIGVCAFEGCDGLTEITIPNSVISIGGNAFDDCRRLTAITIPESVTLIGDDAFAHCSGLTSITIPESVTSIGQSAFAYCNGLTSITIPNSVTSIGYKAFYYCHNLTSITIPESVTSIGDYAFSSCYNLTSITIPKSVTSMGDYAFSSCSGLTSIRIEAVNPPAIEESTFENVDKSIPVYVPTQECVEAYRNAEYWSEFTNIQSYTETLTYDVVVPAGTWECYIIGEFNQMSEFVPMTKINDTHYTITIEGVERSMHYQYACGNGREYVEAGDVRTYNENDVVEGWTNMPAVEAGEPEANRLQSGGVTVSRLYDVLSTVRVPMVVELINEAAISALQCDIYLPEGLSVATVENGLDVAMGNRGSQDHTIDARTLDNGAIRVLVMSGTAAPLTGNAGALFTIGVIPNENYTEDAQIVICNIVMTDTDIVEYNPKQIFADCHIKESVLGDANSDSRVNVTDIVLLAKYILGGYNGNIDVLAADVNQDGELNVTDVVELVALILDGDNEPRKAPMQEDYETGTLALVDTQIVQGTTHEVGIELSNTAPYTAFQMDVTLPECLTIEDVVVSNRTNNHSLQWREQADGTIRIVGYSLSNEAIGGEGGTLLNLVVRADNQLSEGVVEINGITFVTRDIVTHQLDKASGKVSVVTGLNDVVTATRIYATDHKVVVDSPVAQEAAISTIDGVVQRVALQPGRNEIPLQQGVYIVSVDAEVKKVVIR